MTPTPLMTTLYQLACPECRQGCRLRRACRCENPAHHPELKTHEEPNRRELSRLGQEALKLAEMGLPVFPAVPNKKTPATDHGFKDASVDPDRLRRWWTATPNFNIGMRTGLPETCTVLDVDIKNGAGGPDSLAKLVEAHGPLPPTAQIRTPSGGMQYLFRFEPGIRNSASAIAPGIDVRGEGGYILAPPSAVTREEDGVTSLYAWVVPLTELAPMPDWLRKLAAPQAISIAQQVPERIPQRQRNDVLYRTARSLFAQGLSEPSVLAAIRAENSAKCEPPSRTRKFRRLFARQPNNRTAVTSRAQAAFKRRARRWTTPMTTR